MGNNKTDQLRSFYSSQGAMKLKFVPFCSFIDILLCQVKLFSFWQKTMDYSKAFCPKLRPFYSPLESAMKLIFIVPFCSHLDTLLNENISCQNPPKANVKGMGRVIS